MEFVIGKPKGRASSTADLREPVCFRLGETQGNEVEGVHCDPMTR